MTNEIKEITLSELLETDFTINENMEMVGTFTLDRINMISDILTNLQQRIDKAVELLNEPQFELDNIPCNYENDIEKLRNILRGNE